MMMKRETPKRVTLPNGRNFVERYKHVTRAYLPANICIRWPYKQRVAPWGRSRWQIALQQGCGFSSNILKFAKKTAKTTVLWELDKMASNELSNLCNKGTNKIKNKKIERLLQFDLGNSLVDMGTEYGRQKLGWKIFFIRLQTFFKKMLIFFFQLKNIFDLKDILEWN